MPLTPYALRCDHLAHPLGIDNARPVFTWKLRDSRRGARQTQCRLTVSVGDEQLWDSDWLALTDGASGVEYTGPPLAGRTAYRWSVTCRDDLAEDSAPAWALFETALLDPAGWCASFVRRDPRSLPPATPPTGDRVGGNEWLLDPPARFRRGFELGFAPVRARAYVTARGIYRLSVNGARVGRDELTPGWTDYRQRLQYQTYDVTDLLHEGDNAVAATVADGWWSGYVGYDPRRRARHYGDCPEFLAQLVVEGADGESFLLGTDATWREHPGEIEFADLLAGEFHDQRRATPGWDAGGFDDSSWAPALVREDRPTLEAARDEPVRVCASVEPRSVRRVADDCTIVDFGQNLVGRVRLVARGLPAGTAVALRHGETLDGGELYTANLRSAAATDRVIVADEHETIFEPAFTTHGFRYVEITGAAREWSPEDIRASVVHNDVARVGTLRCSDDTVQRLIDNIWWGQRGNFVAVPTDCPQRDERLGWTADAQVFLPTASFNADVAAFMNRWMADLVGAQDADGAFPDVAPLLCADREGAPGWGDAGCVIPHTLWRTYGDLRILRSCYPAMRAWIEHVLRHNPDLVWRHATGANYGDWLNVGADTPRDVVATAYFARSTQLVAESAQALGEIGDAERYRRLAAGIRAAFAANFVTADGAVAGDTQTGHLMALAWGLVPEPSRQLVFRRLCDDIEHRGTRLTTGFLGLPLLCPVLSAGGRDDLAFALLHQQEFPSWGYSIRHGATTVWERWDGWTDTAGFQAPAMNSFNHYAFGSIGEWLWGWIAGIGQPDGSIAYRDLRIAPHLGPRLRWVNAAFDSPRGLVSVEWARDGDRVHGELQIPPGRPARVTVAGDHPAEVRADGRPIGDHTGAEVIGISPGQIHLSLASGTWTVDAPFAIASS